MNRGWPFLVVLGVFAADQAVKGFVVQYMPLGMRVEITQWFNFVHVRNTGAAFSLLADAGGWQRYFFIAVALVICGFLGVQLYRGVARASEAFAYALLAGGALGNVTDRLVRHSVVDYLDFHSGPLHWPAFNLADVAVVTGAGLMFLVSARAHRGEDGGR